MRPSSFALALVVIQLAACGPGSTVCPPGTHSVCDETGTVCSCEPLDAGAGDAGITERAG